MRDTDLVSAITGNTGDSGWKDMIPQVDSSDFPAQWMPSALECSIIDAQAKEIERLRAQAPTARHGRWDGNDCTVCKLPWNYNMVQNADDWGYFDPMPDYCPNCGAKMDGGADNACL